MTNKSINVSAYVAILLSIFTGAIDSTIVANSIPLIAKSFNDYEKVNLITLAFFITSSVVVPIYGKLGDVVGRRNVLVAAQCIFIIGLILGSASKTLDMLIIARAIQGVGGGGIITVAFTSVNDVVDEDSILKYRGYVGIPFTLAGVIGPVVGGYISFYLGWRYIFYILSALTLITIIMTILVIPKPSTNKSDSSIDITGYSLISVFLLSLFLIFFSLSIYSIVFAFVSLLSGYAYVRHSHHGKPISLLPLRYIHFRASSVSSFFVGASLTSYTVFMPLWLQWYMGMKVIESGLYMSILLIALEIVYTLSGFTLKDPRYHMLHMYLGSASLSIGLMIMYMSYMGYISAMTGFIFTSILIGIGVGILIQYNIMIAQSSHRVEEVGASIASMDTFRNVGAYFGISIINIVYTHMTAISGHMRSIEIVIPYGFMIMSILSTAPIIMHLYSAHSSAIED